MRVAQFLRQKIDIVCCNHCLPVNDVVRVNVRRPRPAIAWRQIFEKLDAWSRSCAHSGDAQMRAENLVQMFLLGPEIFALARFAQSEQVAIKLQTRVRVRNPNRSVIDSEK